MFSPYSVSEIVSGIYIIGTVFGNSDVNGEAISGLVKLQWLFLLTFFLFLLENCLKFHLTTIRFIGNINVCALPISHSRVIDLKDELQHLH